MTKQIWKSKILCICTERDERGHGSAPETTGCNEGTTFGSRQQQERMWRRQ